eukprot:s660_g23.t1
MASIALTVIIETRNSDSPGMQSMPQLWKSLHKFLAGPSEEHDVEWNDDLVGFFNAVPRKDMLRSVHTIVREYQQHTGCSVLSIDLLSKTGHPGNPRGRTKSSLKRCCIHDIPAIVELSFSTGAFTAAGKCRAQVEGTAQAQIVESQAVAFASEVQQQAQSHVQAMAADMESQARNRVQAIEQQAQARVSEVSIEASRQLAVANDTIVSLKQQNEMLARQQQDLCGQIATLQNMVAEVKASAVNTSEDEQDDEGDEEEGGDDGGDDPDGDDPVVEPRIDDGLDARPQAGNDEEDFEAATYKYKDLKDLKMPQLPKDSVGFRSRRNALLMQYSAIDRTGQARILRWLQVCMRPEVTNREIAQLQNDPEQLPRLDSFLASQISDAK